MNKTQNHKLHNHENEELKKFFDRYDYVQLLLVHDELTGYEPVLPALNRSAFLLKAVQLESDDYVLNY